MKQEAKVVRGGTIARVMVLRSSACTGDCEGCGFCEAGQPLYVDAYNPSGAQGGQTVVVETETNTVMLSAVLVYLLPLIVFLVVYFAVQAIGTGEHVPIACASGSFVLSFLVARGYNKKKTGQPACTIVEIRDNGGQG